MNFLDTSVLVCSTIHLDENYEKSKHIVNNDWKAVELVNLEIEKLFERRREAYKKVLRFNYDIETKELLIQDIYTRCLKINVDGNHNDERHLKLLFEKSINQMGLDENNKLTPSILDGFKSTLFPLITKIKVEMGAMNHNLQDSDFRSKHIIDDISIPDIHKKLRKKITEYVIKVNKKRFSKSDKNDIKILSGTISYIYDNHIDITFLTNDNFFPQEEAEIKRIIKSFYSGKHHPNLDIIHLNDFTVS